MRSKRRYPLFIAVVLAGAATLSAADLYACTTDGDCAADQCRSAGTCNQTTGQCTSTPVPNGTACDDGNACTRDDVCTAGVCEGASAVTCAAPDTCHEAGICNVGAPPPPPPSTEDLIGWWKLDGDGHDSSGGHDLV